jgi:Zn-dependent protease
MIQRDYSGLIFIIILAIYSMMNSNFNLMATLLTFPGIVLAITFHEYAHARVSDRLGDPTPDRQGRLTLNPLAHLDLVGTIFLIFAGFGWGKPVEINPTYYRNPVRDNMLVAIAGPVTNLILGLLLLLIYNIINEIIPVGQELSNPMAILLVMIDLAAQINVALAVFNMIPLPPLDGSKILRYFLRGKAAEFLYFIEKYSTIILLILFMTDWISKYISPVVYWIYNGMDKIIGFLIGLIL